MTQAQISCFMAVVEHQSFSKAADRLYISQSAVSKQVGMLEKGLGFTLLDRTYGTVKLTQTGKMFYQFFKQVEADFQALLESAQQITSGRIGTVRLGCLDGWDLSQFYPDIWKLFKEKYSNIELKLDGYNHSRILEVLLDGQLDVAITLGATLPPKDKLMHRELTTAPAVILLSAQHPLAQKEDLCLKDLKDESFYVVGLSEQTPNAMETLTVDLCREAGFEPHIERASNSAVILMRLQSGAGAQITCEWTGACRLPMYRAVRLERNLSISAAWLPGDRNPAKHIFLNELLFRHNPFH